MMGECLGLSKANSKKHTINRLLFVYKVSVISSIVAGVGGYTPNTLR